MVEFSWNFSEFKTISEVNGMRNVVYCIEWSFNASDGVDFSSLSGNTYLGSASDENFIEFENLNQNIVEQWIENSIGPDELNLKKSILTNALQSMKDRPKTDKFNRPWK